MKRISLFFFISLSLCFSVFSQEEDFKPSGKVYGLVFGDYYYKLNGDTADAIGNYEYANEKKGDNAFAFRRIYLGYKHQFTPNISSNVLLESNDGVLLSDSETRSVRIKKAYGEWKNIYPGASILLGAMSTPTFSLFTEKIWAYRSVEKTIMDATRYGSSNDVGIALQGKHGKDNVIGYNLMVSNGTGQRVENDKFKMLRGSVNARLLNETILLEIYADYEPTGVNFSVNNIKFFVGYDHERFTAGIETFTNSEVDSSTLKAFGTTAFIRGSIIPDKLNCFVRADLVDRASNSKIGYKEKLFIAGLDYSIAKGFYIMPNIWITSFSEKDAATLKRESDVVARLTFYYKFK